MTPVVTIFAQDQWHHEKSLPATLVVFDAGLAGRRAYRSGATDFGYFTSGPAIGPILVHLPDGLPIAEHHQPDLAQLGVCQ